MKKSDLSMIILIASISVIVAFFVARAIFGESYVGSTKVKTIEEFTSEIATPDTKIFNKDVFNPTVEVNVTKTAEPLK